MKENSSSQLDPLRAERLSFGQGSDPDPCETALLPRKTHGRQQMLTRRGASGTGLIGGGLWGYASSYLPTI